MINIEYPCLLGLDEPDFELEQLLFVSLKYFVTFWNFHSGSVSGPGTGL